MTSKNVEEGIGRAEQDEEFLEAIEPLSEIQRNIIIAYIKNRVEATAIVEREEIQRCIRLSKVM